MVKVTIGFGAGLILLGLVGYIGSGAESLTALLPSALGIILLALGLFGRSEHRRPLAMHIAVAVAVVGFLGSAMGLADLPDLISGEDLERPWAVAVQSIMAGVLLVYIGLAVRSFLDARRART